MLFRSIGLLIKNGSINLLPRFRLQSIGWDLPYRDPAMYEAGRTDWLHLVDWRVTAGFAINTTRDRSHWAGQLGLNWDVASINGAVLYLRGEVSLWEEIPDYVAEIGVRRPIGKLFLRWEDYGITDTIARGDLVILGLGVHL